MFDRIIIIIIMMPAKPWKQFLQHVGYHFSQEARSQPCKRRQWSQPSGGNYGNNGTENHLVNIVGIYDGVKAGVEVIEEVHHLHMIADESW